MQCCVLIRLLYNCEAAVHGCILQASDSGLLQQGVTDIDWRDVVLETKIGAGAFGNVYKGTVWHRHEGKNGCDSSVLCC